MEQSVRLIPRFAGGVYDADTDGLWRRYERSRSVCRLGIKERPGGRIEPLPQIKPYETFDYSVQNRRSPFVQDRSGDGKFVAEWSVADQES